MCHFFTFITCIVITAGAVSDNGIVVKVKRGENFSLCVTTSEPKMVSRFTVRRNGAQEVFRYCSPEEQNHGCKPNNSERCSFQIGKENFSVTFLHASTDDGGVYDVELIDNKNKIIHQKFTVALTGSLKTAEDIPVKKTPWTVSLKQLNIFAGVFAATGSVIYFSLLLIIYCICEKKKQNNANAGDDAGDSESIPLDSSSSGASKATDESLEMVDETECSSQQEGERKDLNHGDRKRMTDKTGRTRHCVDSQNNHRG